VRGRIVGRYAVYGEIAASGVAHVHLGRLLGEAGFTRVVAVAIVAPALARDPAFLHALLDDIKRVSRIRHPNVLPTLDVVSEHAEVLLVTEYAPGQTLAQLIEPLSSRGERVPPRIACAIVAGALRGLQAAHEARGSKGDPLGIVHGDVSPERILVGQDGMPRVLDLGFARAAALHGPGRPAGGMRAALGYLAPEQLAGEAATARSDIYAAGVVLWEALTGRRQYLAEYDAARLQGEPARPRPLDPPSRVALGVPPAVDAIIVRAIDPSPDARYASAREMAQALEAAAGGTLTTEIGAWLEKTAGEVLAQHAEAVLEIERDSSLPAAPAERERREIAEAAEGRHARTVRTPTPAPITVTIPLSSGRAAVAAPTSSPALSASPSAEGGAIPAPLPSGPVLASAPATLTTPTATPLRASGRPSLSLVFLYILVSFVVAVVGYYAVRRR
jgi:serine/threonine-protein kinase